jgi:hypothetical protein
MLSLRGAQRRGNPHRWGLLRFARNDSENRGDWQARIGKLTSFPADA